MAIKVMIIDDSAVVRETLQQVLSDDPDIEVIGTAADPYIAARKLQTLLPDVITLDIEMPRMDGLTFLRKLMAQHPLPVVICSSKAEDGSGNALKALEYGAVDIIEKPKIGTKQFLLESSTQISDVVKAAASARLSKLRSVSVAPSPRKPRTADPAVAAESAPARRAAPFGTQPKLTADAILSLPKSTHVIETTERIAVIGASTGGTEALRVFLEELPPDAPGIVIVQHMPEKFTAAFAKRLDGLCRISVKEAEHNDTIIRGRALIAPGNKHTLVKRSGARYYVEVREGPLVSRHRPSVDVLFRSAARYAGKNAVAVILTGMGDDGARGMLELKQTGAYTIGQDESTCVVYGMPHEAFKIGAVDVQLPLEKIAAEVLQASGVRSAEK
ncbi:protein-glutamate methylesterase/protein-glutamine glutaminase [Spirochaeta africana]|uniref:Protein-glutamate methylesterase/protein-glutamine glutaminase n=1 Tax=Spirochaeta africana (strain ATCC 700263 / DSM 8902 / Z-7692) TaxID=889378 RepID=H9UK79_SPIAZ|nr:chemotaxis response regulator protein-glutamate methylesterase [Spirochaeta africana]AFG37922.1 chemotaxis response regulator containing a CheY-like receiver domain and a methylesterase domain [Spirochaeta africana DSM 8902]